MYEKETLLEVKRRFIKLKKNMESLRKETNCFFEANWDTETKPHIVWDAYKVVIQGCLIALNYKEKRRN